MQSLIPPADLYRDPQLLDPRESMRCLPGFSQPFLTWLTGKPLARQRPWRLRPVHHLLACLVPITAGVGVSAAGVVAGGWWLLVLPTSWLVTTHGIRKLRTMILHQCSHANFWRNKRADTLVGQAIAILLVSQEYHEYRREHVADHHSNNHMTLADPTVQFLIMTMGGRAGMPRQQLWSRMWRTLLSPTFQVRATVARVVSHLRGTSRGYRVAFCLTLAAEVATATATGTWLVFLVAWVVPVTVLFNASAVIRLSSRHVFPRPGPREHSRASIASYTHGIFIGERAPAAGVTGLRWWTSWSHWWLRMLLVHLPCRLFVLVGDGPCHDYHHRYPRSANWANYIFARAADIEAGHPKWPPYTEVWGLYAAIDAAFVSLSLADPREFDPAAVAAVSPPELLASFEE